VESYIVCKLKREMLEKQEIFERLDLLRIDLISISFAIL